MAGLTELTVGMNGAEFRTAFNANFAILPKVYNVKDYGAKGDGVTDDTEIIQGVINTCFDEGGGVIYLPKGVYIVSGALQTAVEYDSETDVNPNSQLYIPPRASSDTNRRSILIKGEVAPPYSLRKTEGDFVNGSTLKSTIAGSGDYPSVIGSCGPSGLYGQLNYTCCYIEDLTIMNHHDNINGVTVGGINFIRTSHGYINNVIVTSDNYNKATLIQPTKKIIGIGIGNTLDDFPRIGRSFVYRGFYYGFALGEGVHCQNISSMRNYIGILSLRNYHYNYIDFASLHWNTYHVAIQDETMYDIEAGVSYLQIDKGSCENDEDPEWTHSTSMVLDTENKLIGRWRSDYNGNLPMTKSGGNNFIMFDARRRNDIPTWTTDTRPTAYATGLVGFNSTTSKLEVHNGTTWVDLH